MQRARTVKRRKVKRRLNPDIERALIQFGFTVGGILLIVLCIILLFAVGALCDYVGDHVPMPLIFIVGIILLCMLYYI